MNYINTYMGVNEDDLLNGVLTPEEYQFALYCTFSYNDQSGTWLKLRLIQLKVKEAIESGKVQTIKSAPVIRQRGPQVITDSAGDTIHGIQSMADGKMYDSKSAYRKSLKEKGLVELGNDAPTQGKGPEASISERELKHDIKTAIEQLGG